MTASRMTIMTRIARMDRTTDTTPMAHSITKTDTASMAMSDRARRAAVFVWAEAQQEKAVACGQAAADEHGRADRAAALAANTVFVISSISLRDFLSLYAEIRKLSRGMRPFFRSLYNFAHHFNTTKRKLGKMCRRRSVGLPQPFGQRRIRIDERGAIVGVDHPAGLGAGRLFDEPDGRVVHRYLHARGCLGIRRGQDGRLL